MKAIVHRSIYQTLLLCLDSEMKKGIIIFILASLLKGKNTNTQQTSPQSNLRRARRSSADKTNSKLLGSHSPSMLTLLCAEM